jgi:hypothetical protein
MNLKQHNNSNFCTVLKVFKFQMFRSPISAPTAALPEVATPTTTTTL